jgi:hypothetical protein
MLQVKQFVELGVDVNAKDIFGNSARKWRIFCTHLVATVHYAYLGGHEKVVRYLLFKKAQCVLLAISLMTRSDSIYAKEDFESTGLSWDSYCKRSRINKMLK